MSTVAHIGLDPERQLANRGCPADYRHVGDVKKFARGYVAVLEEPVSLKVSSDLINAVTRFVFVQHVGEYNDSNAHELPQFLN